MVVNNIANIHDKAYDDTLTTCEYEGNFTKYLFVASDIKVRLRL